MKKIEKALTEILEAGTRIVSFEYHGKTRNVLVGSNQALAAPVWGKVENRAIREHRGQKYLVGLVANEGPRQFKTFKLNEIENLSCA